MWARPRGAGIFQNDRACCRRRRYRPFIEIARRRTPRGDFRTAEMEALPFADGTFDAVTGFNSFQHAASPESEVYGTSRDVKRRRIIVAVGPAEGRVAAGHRRPWLAEPSPPPGAPGPFTLSDEANSRRSPAKLASPSAVIDVPCPWVYADLETALRGSCRRDRPSVPSAPQASNARARRRRFDWALSYSIRRLPPEQYVPLSGRALMTMHASAAMATYTRKNPRGTVWNGSMPVSVMRTISPVCTPALPSGVTTLG